MKITVEGLDKFQSNITEADAKFVSVIRKALTDSVRVVHADAKKTVTVAESNLKGSIRREVRGLTGTVTADQKYAVFVEKGTRPHMPPVAPLERWARIKLGKTGVGFLIARKIAREGTEPQPFMLPALNTNLRNINRYFERATRNLVKILAR